MNIFPAIDIIDGKCVRLTKGIADDKTIYKHSPLDMAKTYEDAGFNTIHVVDLDATLGKGNNNQVLSQIRRNIDINIEVAGGIRSKDAIIVKFLINLDTRIPPCFGYFITISPYCYLHTPYGMLSFGYNLSSFLTLIWL